jgi:toxin YoeB
MNDIIFAPTALAEYMAWQNEDRKTLKKINELIKDIHRNGLLEGIGKPEALQSVKAYSRRIDEKNRLIYTGDANNNLRIISCNGHYEDK